MIAWIAFGYGIKFEEIFEGLPSLRSIRVHVHGNGFCFKYKKNISGCYRINLLARSVFQIIVPLKASANYQ
jgi:hypothetical protein